MNRTLLKNEAKALRSEITGISRRVGQGAVSDQDARSAESKAALASLMEAVADGTDARRGQLAQHATPETAKWESFGHFLQAVHGHSNPASGGALDPRLQSRGGLGANEATPSDGGFLVPQTFSTKLIEAITYESSVARLCMDLPITNGDSVLYPLIDEQSRADGSRWGGIRSAWMNEGAGLPTGKPKFRSGLLNLKKLGAAAYATDELIADSGALGAFVARGFTLEGAYRLDESVIAGSGAGQPQGILNSGALITVAKQVGQAAGTLVTQNVLDMFGRMLPECRKNGVWFVSPEVEEQLYTLNLTVGTGGSAVPLFTPANDGAPFGRLMNRHVIPCEQCSVIGTVGDIIFADPNYYLIAQKPLDIALSVHVRFATDEGLFRMTYRVDGQSALHTPITPFNGGPTKSAFVALAAR